jgi:hypothetical protein
MPSVSRACHSSEDNANHLNGNEGRSVPLSHLLAILPQSHLHLSEIASKYILDIIDSAAQIIVSIR